MNVALTPFLRRSLRTHCRAGKTYLIRGGMLLAMLASVASAQVTARFIGAPGLVLFSSIVWISAFLICLGGPAYFASIITEEKEQMTLGLLKMTGLRPVSILLGKSTSQMLGAIALLLVQLPFTVLSITLGGVSLPQVTAAYLALVAHLVFVTNLGLVCSVVCRRSRRAATLTVVLLLAFYFVPPLAAAVLGTTPGGLLDWAQQASVFARRRAVLTTGFSGSAVGFQVLSNLALGAFFFVLAWAGFERFTRTVEVPAARRARALRRTWGLRLFGPGRAWKNALAWKDFHFMVGGKGMLLLKFILYGLLLGGIARAVDPLGVSMNAEEFGAMAIQLMLFIGFIEVTLCSSRVFGTERKWGTLSSVMILPKRTWQIAYAKVAGCLLALLPTLAWFCVGVGLAGDDFFEGLAWFFSEPFAYYAILQVVFFWHLVAYFSLVLRRGGLLLAFAVCLFGNWLSLVVFFLLGEWAAAGGLILALLGLMAFVHYRILRRLELLAAAE